MDHTSPREQREGEDRDGLPMAGKGPDDHARLPPRLAPLPSGCLKRTAASEMVPKGIDDEERSQEAGRPNEVARRTYQVGETKTCHVKEKILDQYVKVAGHRDVPRVPVLAKC
ncbi:hypothetical protein KFL_010960020 [Klebsormidium nitens]|uniref:Uncharacterized protein n=1 Tax=Klebsormidium nitens TaxID=105231 RepID=A0A1Y1ITN2_KLENI|nr:hypothetical protein KFL_010960020 [Klebsormidium nitens]|eukprot:GAQ92691.1 hypothetical protein KFL_010960020 [Klebsormidium nitens]